MNLLDISCYIDTHKSPFFDGGVYVTNFSAKFGDYWVFVNDISIIVKGLIFNEKIEPKLTKYSCNSVTSLFLA